MTDATLELIILDADSGQLKPARVEIIDGSAMNYVAGDALPVGGTVWIAKNQLGRLSRLKR